MNEEDISYSILELAIVSQGQSFQQTLHNSLALAKAAEECNYTRIWFAEHHNSDNIGSNATSVPIGCIGENTAGATNYLSRWSTRTRWAFRQPRDRRCIYH